MCTCSALRACFPIYFPTLAPDINPPPTFLPPESVLHAVALAERVRDVERCHVGSSATDHERHLPVGHGQLQRGDVNPQLGSLPDHTGLAWISGASNKSMPLHI